MANVDMAYCTIVARNYLPQALTLVDSAQRQQPEVDFHVLVVDGVPGMSSEQAQSAHYCDLTFLGLGHRENENLATIYDVVELSTAVKPRFLSKLLHSYLRVVYLDPDTYVLSPLRELPSLIDEHDVVLTPHLLWPIQPDASFITEASNLTVGIHNLGFCAVGRAGADFLEWWWSHLQRECLIYPLLGLFVDQKWVDMGSVLFEAHTLKHSGYNVGHWNLHERRFHMESDSTYLMDNGEELRLMHFSGFDPESPQEISSRQNERLSGRGLESPGLMALSSAYAAELLKARADILSSGPYGYAHDSSGRPLSSRVRRTYRSDLIAGRSVPSAFATGDKQAFAEWRRRSRLRQFENAATDAAIAFKYAFPDTFKKVKSRSPKLSGAIRHGLLSRSRVRR